MYINHYWVESYGKGEAVVFLHGFTGTVATWYPFRKLLPDHQLILIDLPGHGKTKAKTASLRQCCQDIQQVLAKLGVKSFHLVGYSLGGRTALTLASLFPDHVQSLLLESASPGIMEHEARQQRQKQDQQLAQFIREHPIEAFVDYWENIPLFSAQKKLPADKQAVIRAERLSQSRAGLAHSLEVMGTGVMSSCWGSLPDLVMPIVLVVGEQDQKFVQINQQMDQLLVNSRLIQVKEAGHAIHVEQSDFFGTIVEEFINQRRKFL
ncbi:2-succinyl-6-hydroxy-2,4-cyclohexadiene-1-carboxylate synthase [Gracilibacillus alcaliphilus]|uniref:2-succinyl-6-hydroxy-2, 4-cyclohexadiene-1-carboxylate synthase n=1 Tax=Gracilibacillus alcaliphilus TaxID=1401441 RepID=UPI00195C9FEE|nr:2-succinyl-6-hydroxy-2,4-cyclohexadiene-1-carboxylate synthase [Gracilibacillus alcaliphilus]MBM7675856.1 2-succinyl-6-hydroxy-2,4-cyclohexadiene-1-carboxylate synthase [Gracilibacillus alcaliphilus]